MNTDPASPTFQLYIILLFYKEEKVNKSIDLSRWFLIWAEMDIHIKIL